HLPTGSWSPAKFSQCHLPLQAPATRPDADPLAATSQPTILPAAIGMTEDEQTQDLRRRTRLLRQPTQPNGPRATSSPSHQAQRTSTRTPSRRHPHRGPQPSCRRRPISLQLDPTSHRTRTHARGQLTITGPGKGQRHRYVPPASRSAARRSAVYSVCRETSKRAATSVLGIPISIMTWACSTSIGPNFGCWTYLPFALAIAMPSAWRSLIRRRSNSANAARIPSINESKGEAPLL